VRDSSLGGSYGTTTENTCSARRYSRLRFAYRSSYGALCRSPGRTRASTQPGAVHPETQAEPPVGEPADHAPGRSRGGLSTKVHLASEQGRKMLATTLTARQAADSPQFAPVLQRIRVPRRSGAGRPRTHPVRVLGNKAYSSRGNWAYLRRRGIPATIPVKADQLATGARRARPAGARPRSTPPSTASGTPSNATSTGTNSTAASPPATTSSPFATTPPWRSPTSTSGCVTY
jgi:hypothetical protein